MRHTRCDKSLITSRSIRQVASLLLLAACFALLAACGGEPSDTPATATVAATAEVEPTAAAPADATATVVATAEAEPTAPAQADATATAVPTATPENGPDRAVDGPLAPELEGITGWVNTEPFTLESLRGKVVLIDFWTYTCVNCIRTLPFLKEWHDKYAESGLVIVGVHSPEFEFEKILENVEAAVVRYDLRYPVVQDNQFDTWRAYRNRAWPAKYLIDKDGVIRYQHIGEGAYQSTEQKIRELLGEAGSPVYNIPVGGVARPDYDPKAHSGGETGQTRELYAGDNRNRNNPSYLGNSEYYDTPLGAPTLYQDPGDHKNHLLYLEGLWTKDSESLTHARTTQDLEDYIALQFYGTTVNVVVYHDGNDPVKVVATLNGDNVPEEFSGDDIQRDEDGTSFFLIDEPRMYRVVELPEYNGLELKLHSNSDRFSVFAFTFGSYLEGP